MNFLFTPRGHARVSKSLFIYGLIFGCSLLLLAIPIHISINSFDEGTILNNAYRISLGDSPYVDFWTGYMPGQYYAVGLLFRLFGPSVLVERWWDILIRALFLLALFIFSRDKFKTGYSLIVWLIAVLLLAGSGSYGNPLYPALFWSLTAILLIENYFRSSKRIWIFATGLSIGFVIWFRWDFGVYAGIANSLALFFFLKSKSKKQNDALQMARQSAVALAAGVMVACLLLIVLIFIQGALNEFINQVFVFPATVMQSFRRKSYPSLLLPFQFFAANGENRADQIPDLFYWVLFYYPLLLSLLFAWWVFSGLRKKNSNPQFFSWMAFGVTGLLLIAYSLSRFDYPHALPVSLFVCPLTVLLLSSGKPFQQKPLKTIVFPLTLLLIGIGYLFFPIIVLTNALVSFSPFQCFSSFPRAQCIYMDPDQLQVLDYIDLVTTDSDPIFIGNTRHDRIVTNDISLYFLAGLRAGTPYYALEPGIATTYATQEEIIAGLKQAGVRWIVLVDTPVAEEFNQASVSSQVYLLDNYIAQNYRQEKTFGRFAVLQAVP